MKAFDIEKYDFDDTCFRFAMKNKSKFLVSLIEGFGWGPARLIGRAKFRPASQVQYD